MGPQRHVLCGTLLSIGIYAISRNRKMALSSMLGSIMPDMDHLIEYSKYCHDYSVKPSYAEFRSGKYFDSKGTVYVFFHGWEYVFIGLLAAKIGKKHKYNDITKGFALGYASHMLLDQIGNNVSFKGYLWAYRCCKNWKQKELLRSEDCE